MDAKERKILEDAGVLYPTVVSNGDRVRAMTDEELAEFMNSLLDGCDFEGCPAYVGCHSQNSEMCVEHLNEWLKQECKE